MSHPRIGFACLWNDDEYTTWSYTPWHLRESLRRVGDVVDVGVRLDTLTRTTLKGLHARVRAGRPTSIWRQSRLTDAVCQRQISRRAAARGCDAVLEIQDLAPLSLPFFLYQDMSFAALLAMPEPEKLPPHLGLSLTDLRRRQERQRGIYDRATAVLAMSHWLARSLLETTDLRPEQVHVVHPGISAAGSAAQIPVREPPRRRLLFIGGDFARKAGDQVVGAFTILRDSVDPQLTLTIAGPPVWPLAGEIPPGVRFLGRRPLAEIAQLYDTHDLFIMPSRLEAFGIAFAEALARGLPCIGRNAFAMPEIIEAGVTGALVDSDDPAVLAGVIASTLTDDTIYETCRERVPQTVEHYSWGRAARDCVRAITQTLAPGAGPAPHRAGSAGM